MKTKIIGLVGKRASGKDVAAKYLSRKYKVNEIILSNFIYQALDVLNIPPNRRNIAWFIQKIRSRFGREILADSAIKKIKESNPKLVIVNGIRVKKEFEMFKKNFGRDFSLVTLFTNDNLRWKRVIRREKKTKINKDKLKKSLKSFLVQERRIVTEKDIPYLEKHADYVVENNGTQKELFKKLDELVNKIKTQRKS